MATQPDTGGSPTLGVYLAQRARAAAEAVARQIAYPVVTPNFLTVVGFILTVGVAAVIASGWEQLGGVLVLLVGLFDMLDGAMARVRGLKTRFGAFLDSTLDRFSEAVLLGGVLWLHHGDPVYGPWYPILTLAVLTGSLLVSYTRARAEGLDIDCQVGWLPRPQRVILLSAGLITGLTFEALVILAVFTNVTTLQRILHVRRTLAGR
ncbi:MAG TPA: CDP-alcohol phosphatidyltransferase family protein [Chloroflexota bacterium]|nr:CDP-alcohol phosphatidyltransferase family protein [Chloroflexota bacterium]